MKHAISRQIACDTYSKMQIPFIELLGIKDDAVGGGRSRLTLELRPELRDMYDACHGGVIMTMLDVAMVRAALSSRDFLLNVVTVSMTTSFLKPGIDRLVVEGRVVSGEKSLCFCEATIVDATGEAVAKAIGTFEFRQVMLSGEGN